MPIIKHNDYNTPANGDTVIELDPHSMNGETGKAFKVQEGIWIIPNSKGDGSRSSMQSTNRKIVSVDYPGYCSTDTGKSKFLEQTSTLFERIETTSSGKNLLKLSSIPAPTPGSTTTMMSEFNSIVGKNPQNTSTCFPAGIVVRPSETGGFYTITKGITGTSTIYFNPEIAHTTAHPLSETTTKSLSEIKIVDPAMSLYHELVHGMRASYATPFSADKTLDEVITFGDPNELKSRDAKKIKFKKYVDEYKNDIKDYIELLNSEPYPVQEKEALAYKYMLKNTGTATNPKYTYTNSNFDKLCDHIFGKKISELQFSKEIKSPTRSRYFAGFGVPLEIDVTNPNIYTVKNGIKGSRLFKDNPDFKVHPKTKIFNPNDPEKPGTTELFNYCSSRKRRDLETLLELPNCIPYPEDKDKKIRTKRAAKSCIEFLEEEFTPMYEKMKKFPNKLLGNLTDKKIQQEIELEPEFEPVEELPPFNIKLFHTPLKNTIEINIPNSTIHSDPIGSARFKQNFKRPTNEDIVQAHRFSPGIDQPIDFVSRRNSVQLCTDCANNTYTHEPEIAERANGAMEGANKIANIAGIGMWLDTLYNDFTDKTRASKFSSPTDNALHLSRDILNIVPYVGVVFNIGVDIYDENYEDAFENMGIFILLEAFPELLPFVMIGGLIEGWIKEAERKAEKRDFIKKTIQNMLEQEDELLDLSAVEMEHTWANAIHQKTLLIAKSAVQQMQYNFDAIIHNAFILLKQFKGSEQDKKNLREKIDLLEENMEKHLDDVYHAICKTIFKGLRKGVVEQYKKSASKFEATMNDATKDAISNILSENDPAIEEWFKTECLSTVDDFYKKHNIKDKLAKQILELEKLLDKEEQILKYERLPAFSLVVGNDNKLKDTRDNAIIKRKNLLLTCNDMPDGEIHFSRSKKSILKIPHHLFLPKRNFTLSFWIKMPLMRDNMEHEISMFSIHLLDTLIKKPVNLINKWIHVSYSCRYNKNSKHSACSLYTFDAISGLDITHINSPNKHEFFKTLFDRIRLLGDFSISGLKYYYVALTKKEQKEVLNKEAPRDYLYDSTGAPLRYNKEYILKSRALDNKKITIKDSAVLLKEEQNLHKEIPNFYDREGLKVKLVIPDTSKNPDKNTIKNNSIINITQDNISLGLDIDKIVSINIDPYFVSILKENTTGKLERVNQEVILQPKATIIGSKSKKGINIKIAAIGDFKGIILATTENNTVNGLITAPIIKNYKNQAYRVRKNTEGFDPTTMEILDLNIDLDFTQAANKYLYYLKEDYNLSSIKNFIKDVPKSAIDGVPIPLHPDFYGAKSSSLIDYLTFDFYPVSNISHDFFNEWDFNKKK